MLALEASVAAAADTLANRVRDCDDSTSVSHERVEAGGVAGTAGGGAGGGRRRAVTSAGGGTHAVARLAELRAPLPNMGPRFH